MPDQQITVTELEEVTPEVVAAFDALIPQLSSSSPPPTPDELAAMVTSDSTRILVARDADGSILGSMSLVVFRIPTGVRAWIEDVVVHESGRGSGVGATLITTATQMAIGMGAKTVDLTSRPTREAANRLYRRLGFEARETNVYRYQGD